MLLIVIGAGRRRAPPTFYCATAHSRIYHLSSRIWMRKDAVGAPYSKKCHSARRQVTKVQIGIVRDECARLSIRFLIRGHEKERVSWIADWVPRRSRIVGARHPAACSLVQESRVRFWSVTVASPSTAGHPLHIALNWPPLSAGNVSSRGVQ